jgi:NitT/TauT family transport system substrate-binding protein
MNKNNWRAACVGLGIAASTVAVGPACAEDMEAVFSLPAITFSFVPVYVAEDQGYWSKRGIKMKTIVITGIGSMNAVLARSAEFTLSSTPTIIRANIRGQKVLAIASASDQASVEIVLRKDLAEAAGITEKTPLAQRAQALKGKKIALQGLNAIPHGFLRYFAKKGPIDSERDVQLAVMQPEAGLAALKSKQIDGLAEVLPYSTMAVHQGSGVVIGSAPKGDFPELNPYANNAIAALASTCEAKPQLCLSTVAGFAEAVTFIHEHPKEAGGILKKRIPNMDDATFDDAFEMTRRGIPKTLGMTEAGLRNAQALMLVGGMIKDEEKLSSFGSIHTNAYVK